METRNVTKNSMKILAFIYKRKKTSTQDIVKNSNFELGRVRECVDFLEEEGLIEANAKVGSGDVLSIKCTSYGIKMVETPEESETNYGYSINLNINVDSIFKTDSILKASLM